MFFFNAVSGGVHNCGFGVDSGTGSVLAVPQTPKNAVVNLTNTPLTEIKTRTLSYGLNFAIHPPHFNPIEVQINNRIFNRRMVQIYRRHFLHMEPLRRGSHEFPEWFKQHT